MAVVLGGLWLSASPARAQAERVLLLDTPALRPGLCAALRIQLVDVAQVECVVDPEADAALATRIELAARQLASRNATLGVLLERDPAPERVRMMLIGSQPDRALLAIEAIEDRPAPDVDRSLALKVRDTLETVVRARSELPVPLAAALVPRPARALHGLFEVGGAAALGTHVRGAGLLSAALRLLLGDVYAELALAARLDNVVREASSWGHVRERERGFSLALRAGRQWRYLSLGALAEAEIVRMSADGVTLDGTRGSATFASARLGIGGDLRVLFPLGRVRAGVRLAPTLRVGPVAQRFALDHHVAFSAGRAEVWLPLSLVIELPGGDDA